MDQQTVQLALLVAAGTHLIHRPQRSRFHRPGGAALCVSDPACTLVTCEGNTFLAIIHITDILIDSRSHLDIDLSLLFEPTVNLQFQICHFVEQIPQVDDVSAIEDAEEWRWNGKLDSKVMTVKGSFIQVLNPTL